MSVDRRLLDRTATLPPGTALSYPTGGWRERRPVHRHRAAGCHRACPAFEDPQFYIQKLQEHDPRAAFESIVAVNPLPAVTGRVCPHPCEDGCHRGRFDQPLAIHAIERHIGDLALEQGWLPELPPLEGEPRVAVVGSGPAGLSAAWQLRRAGIGVVVYEALPLPGGLLRTALPHYRLPRDVLDGEIKRLREAGILFRCHERLGTDIFLDDLERTYEAVILAIGLHAPRPWSIQGATPGDLHPGLQLLEEWIDVGAAPLEGRVVVVHGGGNTAIDVARMALRAGAREVHVVSTRALPDDPSALGPEDRMQAFPREIRQAVEEGVVIHPHAIPTRLIIRGGRLQAVEIAAVRAVRGPDGRTRRVPFEGTERILRCDMVIPATGEVADLHGLETLPRAGDGLASDALGRVPGRPAVFVAGDVSGRGGSVSAAIGDGHRVARAVLHHLHVLADPAIPEREPVAFEEIKLRYFDHLPREEPPERPPQERVRDEQEIEGSLDPVRVAAEISRCFSCGNCLACDNCWTFCPDLAVLKTREVTSDGSHYVIDYEFCKGCGICAHECPPAFILMEDEPPPAIGRDRPPA